MYGGRNGEQPAASCSSCTHAGALSRYTVKYFQADEQSLLLAVLTASYLAIPCTLAGDRGRGRPGPGRGGGYDGGPGHGRGGFGEGRGGGGACMLLNAYILVVKKVLPLDFC